MGREGESMNRTRAMLATGVVVAASGVGLLVASATAAPPPGVIPPHQHYVITADGDLVPVGPNSCANGPSKQFDNFHLNGHVGVPGANGVITGRPCS
jgi:hypothetical protein